MRRYQEAPRPDVREGLVTVALLHAMDEAATTGCAVQVREVLQRHGLGHLGDPVPSTA